MDAYLNNSQTGRATSSSPLQSPSCTYLDCSTCQESTQRYMGEVDTARNDAALEKVFELPNTHSEEDKLYEQLSKMDRELLMRVLVRMRFFDQNPAEIKIND